MGHNVHDHVKRDSRLLCSLALFNHLQKREVDINLADVANTTSLLGRDMTLPGDSETIEQYVISETSGIDGDHTRFKDPTMRRLHWRNTNTGYDVNTAEFKAFADQAFGYNLVGLSGVCFHP